MDSCPEPDDKMDITLQYGWTDPSNDTNLGAMSAVCFLYARNIYDKLNVPLGLIDSAYGGTTIEAWSSLEMLDQCGLGENGKVDEAVDGPKANGVLWNKMIYPLRKNTLKGFLWYQGENNAIHNRD